MTAAPAHATPASSQHAHEEVVSLAISHTKGRGFDLPAIARAAAPEFSTTSACTSGPSLASSCPASFDSGILEARGEQLGGGLLLEPKQVWAERSSRGQELACIRVQPLARARQHFLTCTCRRESLTNDRASALQQGSIQNFEERGIAGGFAVDAHPQRGQCLHDGSRRR
jgi:hypothetical protein